MEKLKLLRIKEEFIDKCVDLYIETFSKEPWNDVYESREQVVKLFNNHLNNNYFVGYVAMLENKNCCGNKIIE